MKKTTYALLGSLVACAGGEVFIGKHEPQAQNKESQQQDATAPCIVTGCSGEVCAADEVVTTCEVRPEYQCYQGAECARQDDGGCAWTETEELKACLAAPQPQPQPTPGACVKAGCSGTVCADEAVASEIVTTCEGTHMECYAQAECTRQADGECGFTQDAELLACLANEPLEPCVVTGCSGTLCADAPMVSTCEARSDDVCYETAVCERQSDGACAWTQTAALQACLASFP